MKNIWNKHKLLILLIIPAALSISALILGLLFSAFYSVESGLSRMAGQLFFLIMLIGFFFYPFFLTALNIYFLCTDSRSPKRPAYRAELITETLTLLGGSIYTLLYLMVSNIMFQDFNEVLTNAQIHTPIKTQAFPTILTFLIVGILGCFILRPYKKAAARPPLITVTGISMLYVGIITCVVIIVQLSAKPKHLWLAILPFNCILIAFKMIRRIMQEWLILHKTPPLLTGKSGLSLIHSCLQSSRYWPALAILLLLPLLGVLLAVLILFGQTPDSFIKAFTETSEWALSQKTSPANVMYDEHYLCTVAAGGHKRLVKPLRTGKRHGHQVIVNRQLCVANAFEQILEEKTPRFHKYVRRLYDHYGYPIARHIRSSWAADMIYLLMKPAEWFFLLCLYLFDTKPENRIALQYLGKIPAELETMIH